MNDSVPAIAINDVHKAYGRSVVLKGVSLEVARGTFIGVFGKNGAGKSTLFKIILGVLNASDGEVLFNGEHISKSNHPSIGYLPENVSLYGYLSVQDNLQVAALSAGVELSKESITDILEKVNLLHARKKTADELSLGMKRRLQFAMSTMIKPVEILVLDEPTNGMDVNGVIWLKQYLLEMKKMGITILVCSHSLNLMEELIDEYCILQDGKIIKHEAWNRGSRNKYEILMKRKADAHLLDYFNSIGQVVNAEGQFVTINCEMNLFSLIQRMVRDGLEVLDVDKKEYGLEDIFLESVGQNVQGN